LAWSQVVDVDTVEPLYLGDVRVSPSATALVMLDSNPAWQPERSQAVGVRGLHPELGLSLDVPETAVNAELSTLFLDVMGNGANPLDSWLVAQAAADIDLFRLSPVGVRAAYEGHLRSDGGARDLLLDAPSMSNDVELGIPMRLSSTVGLEISGQLRSSSYRFWGLDGRVRPSNYSDAVSARAQAVAALSDSVQVGAEFAMSQHQWGASSLYVPMIGGEESAVTSLRDAMRPIGQLTTELSTSGWSLHVGLGWDGTQIRDAEGAQRRLELADRLVGELQVTVRTPTSSLSLSFERFNDRPIVADLSAAVSAGLEVETEVVSFVRLGTVSGVRTDEMLSDDPWRTTHLHAGVYGAVDLSPNLTTTVAMDGVWRDHDPFERRPISKVAATLGLTGRI
jgi:hypothetical protein